MNRKDLQELRVHYGYPAITIIMPCDKKRLQETAEKLLATIKESPLPADALERISDMFEKIEGMEGMEGMDCTLNEGKAFKVALFIDKHRARSFLVPSAVADVAICNSFFKLDGITTVLNHTFRYWVIDCKKESNPHTSQTARLLEGMGDNLIPLQENCVLFDAEKCEREGGCPATCFTSFMEQDPLPVVLVGCATQQELTTLFAPYKTWIAAHVESHEEILPAIDRWHAAEIEKTLKKITHPGATDFQTNFHEIVLSARQGFVSLLIVEQGYMRAGCEHPVTRDLILDSQCPTGYVFVSAIDELVEEVRSKGGSVLLVPDGSLKAYGRMVAFVSTQG